jgi:glutathione synthase/RimK-type ligase-like ATP-grasp enzyme
LAENADDAALNPETAALLAAAAEHFDEVVRIHPHRVMYRFARGTRPRVQILDEDSSEGCSLADLDVLVVRGVRRYERSVAVLARALHHCGCRLLDPLARFDAIGASKLLTALDRCVAGVGTDTFLAFSPEAARQLLSDLAADGVFPLIAKPVDGSQGLGITALPDPDAAERCLQRFFASRIEPDVPFFLQRLVRFTNEYRVLVVQGRSLGVAEKIAPEGKVVANAVRGGSFRGAIAPEVEDFALAQVGGKGILGVDVARDETGELHLLEANPAPLWTAFEEATGVDVATDLIRAARRWAESDR